MAEYEVAGTHTMISLEGAYLSIYVRTYICMPICQAGRFLSSLIKRVSRGRRHSGEDELVTDNATVKRTGAIYFTFHFCYCVWRRLQNSVIIKTQ